MKERDVLGEVRHLARERLKLTEELKNDSRLIEDLGLDSLQLQGLAVEVENHFRICLEPEDEEAIETVGDLVTIVQAKLAEEPTATPQHER
jgi:acyl carrier protein